MAKDAKGHGSEGRGGKFEPSATGNKKFLGQGGKADPNRPVIERHDAPFGVLGYFHAQTGAPVARSVAEDMAGRGQAQIRAIPVRDQDHSEQIRQLGSGVSGGPTRLGKGK